SPASPACWTRPADGSPGAADPAAAHPAIDHGDTLGPQPASLLAPIGRREAAVGADDAPPGHAVRAPGQERTHCPRRPGKPGLRRNCAVGGDLTGTEAGEH